MKETGQAFRSRDVPEPDLTAWNIGNQDQSQSLYNVQITPWHASTLPCRDVPSYPSTTTVESSFVTATTTSQAHQLRDPRTYTEPQATQYDIYGDADAFTHLVCLWAGRRISPPP